MNLTGVTITQCTVLLINPNGSTLANVGCPYLDVQTLPTTGTYAALLDPAQAYTGNATVTLYDVPANITGSLTVNDPAVNVTIAVPGQQAVFTFPAAVGQAITVRGANSTIACYTNIFLTTPSGGTSSASPCTASWSIGNTPSQNGTFTFRLDPTNANTGSVAVSVTSP